MKTTVDIADPLWARAKRLARSEGITLRRLIEEGLRETLRARQGTKRERLRPITFAGQGLSPDFQNAGWDQIRDAIYEGRGV